MSSITLRGVEKHYGSNQVLFDCNLEIHDHEFMVIVGPSGSGKTTVLRIIAGLEPVTRGEVYFGDRIVNNVDVGDRDVAMVFQNYGLYPHMSVYDNMAFGLRRRKLEKPEIDKRVRDAASMLGIAEMLKRRPKQLSGGQRQRVALGRAIVRDPEVFLLDEPLSNLDAHLRVQMRAEILRVHRAVTATAVYVTHDQVEALTMGDRIVVMHEGRIQQVGPPEELYDRPVNRFVAGFIGTPAMGFLECTLAREGDRARVEGPGVRIELTRESAAAVPLAAGSKVVAGVRPEHLEIVPVTSAGQEVQSYMKGVVEVVEPLGWEQHVLIDVSGAKLTARTKRDNSIRPDDKVAFAVDGSVVHLFDSETGEALR
jgi:multiple sugar transport system ATP-binding protein